MLYENYRAKMNKLASVLGVARRFRVLIFCVLTAIIAVTATFFAITGIVYDVDKCPESISVGERLSYNAGAVFGSVRYEFAVKNTDEWSEIQPTRPGEYLVRSVSKSVFGTDRRGGVHSFVITPRTVEVRVAQSEVVYGEPLTAVAELSYSDKLVCDGFIYEDYSAAETSVRADENSVTVTDENGNDVSRSYNFKFVESRIKFIKRDITVTVENRPETYSGSPYLCGGYEIENAREALAENDYAVVSAVEFDGTVGEYDITPEVRIFKSLSGTVVEVTENYNINLVSGKLSVEKRPVYVSTGSGQKVYDGTALTCAEYSIDENFPLVEGHSLEIADVPVQLNAGESNNVILFKVFDGEGNDVTDNYSVLYLEYGTLTVDKRKVALLSADDSSIYDNTPKSCEKYFILEMDGTALFADGETAVVTANTEGVLAGEYQNILEYAVLNADGEDVTENYDLIKQFGTLTVEPRPLSIKTFGDLWIYDGEAHTSGAHTVADNGYGLLEGHRTYASGLTTITDAGEVPNLMSIGVYDDAGNNLTANYKINISVTDAGMLVVQKRAITLTAGSAEKVYDGEELTCEIATAENLVEGHTFTGKTAGSRTNYGESENQIDRGAGFTVTDADGSDVTGNYTVAGYVNGTLTVTKRPITVKTESKTFTFNGEYNDCADHGVAEEDGLVSGHTTKAFNYALIRNVSESGKKNTMTVTVFDGETDVTENYEITYDEGVLSVTPRDVFVETNSNTWIYDGAAHSDGGFIDAPFDLEAQTGLVGEHKLASSNATEIINAGSKSNEMEFTVKDGEVDESENYTVQITKYGELSITKRPVTITTGTATKVYDDEPLSCNTVTSSAATENSGLVSGHTAKAEGGNSITEVQFNANGDVTYAENTATLIICDGDGNPVTDNYKITEEWGKLTVTKRPVTITTGSDEKVYDGNELKCEKITASETAENIGLVNGHEIETENTKTITDVQFDNAGEVTTAENTATLKIYRGTGEVTPNYEITPVWGALEITPRPITVTACSDEKVYDGTPLTCSEVEVKEDNSGYILVEGHTITATTVGSQTEVGSSDNVITEDTVKITFGDNDVTANYSIEELVKGTLTVTSRPITVVADSDTKVYDGTELTLDQIFVKDGEYKLAKGHSISGSASGSQTDVGTGKNAVVESSIVIKDGEQVPVTDNYLITFEEGELTVTPRPITVFTDGDQKEYDGYALTNGKYHLEYTGDKEKLALVLSHEEALVVTGSQTVYGESDNTVDEVNIKIYSDDSKAQEVTANYTFTYSYGKLSVYQRKITVVTEGATKAYDGTPLTCGKYEIIYSGTSTEEITPLVLNHTEEVIFNGSQTIAGTSNNTIERVVIYSDGTRGQVVTYNYDIDVHSRLGTLEVTKREISVTTATNTDELIYDGTAQFDNGFEITEGTLAPDQTAKAEKNVPTVTDVAEGEKKNEFAIIITDANGAVTTSNYEIAYTYGNIKINPRPITVKAADDSKIYNGKPRYGENAEVISDYQLVDGHTILIETTLSSSANCGEYSVTVIENSARINGGSMDSNYSVTYDTVSTATLTVTWRPIEIITATDEWTYDGVEHSNETLTVEQFSEYSGLVSGHSVNPISSTCIKNVGYVTNEVEFDIFDANGLSVKENYEIELTLGTLTVTARQITVTAGSAEKEYDGTELSASVIFTDNLVEWHEITAEISGSLLVPGTEASVIVEDSVIITDEYGEVVTSNYEITLKDGLLTVYPREITVTTGSDSRAYNGLPLTCEKFNVIYGNGTEDKPAIVEGQTVSAVIYGSQTEVGSSYNAAYVIITDDRTGADATDCYKITYKLGTLTVTEPEVLDPILMLKVLSELGGDIYLKNVSYGDYNGTTQWNAAPEYGGTLSYNGKNYSLDYLFGFGLMNAGYGRDTLSVNLEFDACYLPYYTALGEYGYTVQTSDVRYRGDLREYSLAHYFYNYVKEGIPASFDIAEYKDIEVLYRAFVYENYLNVKISDEDFETEAYLDELIRAQGFAKNDPDIIKKVASYIQNAATYNLKYDPAVDSENVLISFLELKEGVCRHYATAATLVFRRLGIPARYTGGFHTSAKAGEWKEVYNIDGHAWVEVYLDGFGWVQVEVTGSVPGENEIDEDINDDIILKPAKAIKYYDGEPLYATELEDDMYLRELTAKGYVLSVSFGGSQTEVGKGVSVITSYTLFDKDGNNLTSYFPFRIEEGELEVVDPAKQIILYFNTYVTNATYNDTEFTVNGYYISDKENGFRLPAGVTASVSGLENVKLTSAGVITESEFAEKYIETGLVKITVSDALHRQPVFKYNINFSVARRSITVKTNSVTKEYDGKPLKDDTCIISGEGLVEGHSLEIMRSASITDIGEKINNVSYRIVDAYGNDVTGNYMIDEDFGVLTVISD